MGSQVLFLCSGNYYRSRFAEILFNLRARQAGLGWTATSRALAIGRSGWVNDGPISRHVLAWLAEKFMEVPETARSPKQACAADLEASDLVIAMKEAEHRRLVEEIFPALADRVEYWHIHDQDCCEPKQAMGEIEEQVEALVRRLGA